MNINKKHALLMLCLGLSGCLTSGANHFKTTSTRENILLTKELPVGHQLRFEIFFKDKKVHIQEYPHLMCRHTIEGHEIKYQAGKRRLGPGIVIIPIIATAVTALGIKTLVELDDRADNSVLTRIGGTALMSGGLLGMSFFLLNLPEDEYDYRQVQGERFYKWSSSTRLYPCKTKLDLPWRSGQIELVVRFSRDGKELRYKQALNGHHLELPKTIQSDLVRAASFCASALTMTVKSIAPKQATTSESPTIPSAVRIMGHSKSLTLTPSAKLKPRLETIKDPLARQYAQQCLARTQKSIIVSHQRLQQAADRARAKSEDKCRANAHTRAQSPCSLECLKAHSGELCNFEIEDCRTLNVAGQLNCDEVYQDCLLARGIPACQAKCVEQRMTKQCPQP